MSGIFTLLFPILALSAWIGVHYYFGRSVIPRTSRKIWRTIAWTVLMVLGVLTLVVSVVGRAGADGTWLDPLYWITYLYMGFFSIALFLIALKDLGVWLSRIPARVESIKRRRACRDNKDACSHRDAGVDMKKREFLQKVNLGALGLSGLATSYGAYEALREVEVVEVEVPIKDLPEDLDGFRIAQISDLHVGPTVRKPFVERVVKTVNGLNADMIAITGDLVDGYVESRGEDVAPLAQLKAKEGVFYVTGNHEYYWGAIPWVNEVRRLGIKALMNAHEVIQRGKSKLIVAGVTDYRAERILPEHTSDPKKALEGAPEGFKLILAHQPKSVFAASSAGADLQLSGHTHGGQYVPWSFIVWLVQPFVAGLHQYNKMKIYVSRGTGYWGPPVRIAAPPEITHLTLVRA